MRALPLSIGVVHFIGIGGIGMSGIAEVLHNLGYSVQGSDMAEGYNVTRLREAGIPVMGHLGLTPQSIHQFGSYRTRGTTPKEAEQILRDAQDLEKAGCFAVLMEKIPSELAQQVTEALSIPTVGIGAGPHCDGQILVYTDMLGITNEFQPRFVRRYDVLRERMIGAFAQYAEDVRSSNFPSNEESY